MVIQILCPSEIKMIHQYSVSALRPGVTQKIYAFPFFNSEIKVQEIWGNFQLNLLPYRGNIPNLVEIGSVVLEKKLKMLS